MAANYDDVLAQLNAAGLILDHGLEVDGRTHRCRVDGMDRERRGWYVLHVWQSNDGDDYLVGAFGVWQGTDNNSQRIELPKGRDFSSEEKAAFRARLAEDRKRAKAQRAAEATRAARKASTTWSALLTTPPGDMPYLERKQVGAHGVRFTESGAIAIPMQDARSNVHGLQFILPDGHPKKKKLGRAKTFWPAGLQVAGRFHLLGSPAASPVCLIAEGYATAATLHEETDLPCAVAFSANNLVEVARALRKAYRSTRFLICADDDYLTDGNPGKTHAAAAALAVGGAWIAPAFPGDRGGEKLTDFNDLALFPSGGPHLVRQQVFDELSRLEWPTVRSAGTRTEGDGEPLRPLLSLDEANARYALVYGGKATLFDRQEHCLVPKADVLDILPSKAWDDWKQMPTRQVVRVREVGFDPTESDPEILCNLWGGWPTTPAPGECDALLDLLRFMCQGEERPDEIYDWLLNWLAYPIQHQGAKMRTAVVCHGGQGVGKNLFFEAVKDIYGEYGSVIDQAAVEDKFNDWASRKLFMVADEVVARAELWHLKNKLKGVITGQTIRINGKNVTAWEEANHVNLVFLSNERQPVALEADDRRYAVIWVQDKLPTGFYDAVGAEIENGGVAALHHFLLQRDLGDFRPWTSPPATRARGELIEVSLDSSERFVRDWIAGETAWPFMPCGSMDLYRCYKRWAIDNGVRAPRESNHFLAHLNKSKGWAVRSTHIFADESGLGGQKSQKMVFPPTSDLEAAGRARKPDERVIDYATRCYFKFKNRAHDFDD